MRIAGRFLLFPALLALGASFASAQTAVDVGIGFGSAWDKANGQGIDNASSLTNAFGSCTPGSADIYCQATSSMTGFLLGFGGDIMLYKKLGVGAEFNVQPAQKNYGPLQDRQMFYDFNAIYQPISTKRVALRVEGESVALAPVSPITRVAASELPCAALRTNLSGLRPTFKSTPAWAYRSF